MEKQTMGIHHITAIVGHPQENVDFYAGILGLRLVKKQLTLMTQERIIFISVMREVNQVQLLLSSHGQMRTLASLVMGKWELLHMLFHLAPYHFGRNA